MILKSAYVALAIKGLYPGTFDFKIRCDVTRSRLRISGELPLNTRVVYGIGAKRVLYGYMSEIRYLLHVTSRLISQLDRVVDCILLVFVVTYV